MKKQVLILAVLLAFGLLFSKNTNAQGMEVGKNNLGIGLGLGRNYYSGLGGFTPAMRLNFDHGFFNAGPGVITIGGSVGFSRHTYDYGYSYYYSSYKATWTNIVIATRAAWHYNFGKIGNEKFNAYAGIGLGVRIESYRDNYSGPYAIDDNYGGVNGHFATFVGGSYQATEKLGFFAEFGYDITSALIGVNFRF
jgi:hypothetical protein